MEEMIGLLYLQLDWVTVAAFFAIALFYFLAPVLGYSNSSRLLIVTSLGALVAKMGLAFVRIALIHFEFLDRGDVSWRSFNPMPGGGDRFLDLLVRGMMP